MRLSKTVDGVVYKYYYAGDKLMRLTVGDSVVMDFIYGSAGEPYAVKYNGTVYYYILNLQGDVVRIVNSAGTSFGVYKYDAWGNILYQTTTNQLLVHNPLRYRGYVYDAETGFYYLSSRYYDPEIGRFINADSFASTGQGVLGYNMFAYCNNNSTNYVDPTGTRLIPADALTGAGYLTVPPASFGGGGGGRAGYGSSGVIAEAAIVVGGVVSTGLLSNMDDLVDEFINSVQASLTRTKARTYKTDYEIHHIAAKKAFKAKEAQKILAEVYPDGVENHNNKVQLKTAVHRRVHTTVYYTITNYMVVFAYNSAAGNIELARDRVTESLLTVSSILKSLEVFVD